MTRDSRGRSGSRSAATDSLEPMLARRIAAAALALGLGGATLAGAALVLVAPATAAVASPPRAAVAVARPQDTTPAPAPSSAAPPTLLPVPTTPAAQPTDSPTEVAPTDQPTVASTTEAPPTEVASPTVAPSSAAPTVKPRSTSTASGRATGTPKPTSTRSAAVYRSYAPASPAYYNPNGTTETGAAYPYTGAAGDLPSAVAATGAPLTTGTVKPATSADPIYIQATSAATTTARKYIDVNGVSIDGVLGDAAIAGGILGLLGGAGLWFTRGAR